MRVLHVCSWFPVRSETFVFRKVLSQLASGQDVRVLITDFGSANAMPIEALSAPGLAERVHSVPRWRAALLQPGAWWGAHRARSAFRGVDRCGIDSLVATARWMSGSADSLPGGWAPDLVHAHFGHRALLAAWLRGRLWPRAALVGSFLGYDVTEMPVGAHRRMYCELTE